MSWKKNILDARPDLKAALAKESLLDELVSSRPSLQRERGAAQLQSGGFLATWTVPRGSLCGSIFHAGRTFDVDITACAPRARQFGSVFESICSRVFRTLKMDNSAVLLVAGSVVQSLGAFSCFRALDVDIPAVPLGRGNRHRWRQRGQHCGHGC